MKKFVKLTFGTIMLVLLAIVLRSVGFAAVRLIYPLKYEDYIIESSLENGLDPYFVMAVIKTESNYNPTAHSGVARGLMQITDNTAAWIAEKMGIEFHEDDIENPELNIKMGCYYLRYLSDMYSDRTLILASYNAGMGNVSKWLEDSRFSEDSETLIDIPFDETRKYVDKVNRYEDVYKKLYRNIV